jgi:DNA-binding transcriptional LysR family regulator
MDRLRELEVFIAVAEAGSFNRAAARLRLSPPVVTRAVSALEERLGARVFQRTTRSLSITEVGQRFLESSRRVVAELDAAVKGAVGESAAPQGHLSVTASVTFGRLALAPVVTGFLAAHPQVTASLLLVDRVVNLVEEGIDVAVRIGNLPDSGLVARRVGAVHRVLVASPAYLRARGAPASPQDLRHHSIIGFSSLMPNREWRYRSGGRRASLGLAPRLEVNDAATAIDAAEAGHGITLALSYMVGARIRAGALAPVLARFALPPEPVHLVYPSARLLAPKTRAFVDHATPALKAALEELEGTVVTPRTGR